MEKKVIESKITSLLTLLEKLKSIMDEHKKNKDLQEYLLYAAEKKAEELVELAVSINQELLRDKNKVGLSYYDSFTELVVFNQFKKEELQELASTAGFRNRLAHEYLDIDESIALRSMQKILRIYPLYIQKVESLLQNKK